MRVRVASCGAATPSAYAGVAAGPSSVKNMLSFLRPGVKGFTGGCDTSVEVVGSLSERVRSLGHQP